MKAYQKYVIEHKDEIHQVLLDLLYILDKVDDEQYSQYDIVGTSTSDKLKAISRSEYATLHCAKCLLDVMSTNNIEITFNIAYKIGHASHYIARYIPPCQCSSDLIMHLYDVSRKMLDKTHKAHMKELYPTVLGKEKG